MQATTVTVAAQAAADAAAIAEAEAASGKATGAGGESETTIKALELFKLSHNIKKMLGGSLVVFLVCYFFGSLCFWFIMFLVRFVLFLFVVVVVVLGVCPSCTFFSVFFSWRRCYHSLWRGYI